MLSQSEGWLNGLIAVRAPIAQKAPTVARATKQLSFMPKYLPTTASGPICEFLLRNSGPRMVDLMMRAPALSRMMPWGWMGSEVVFSNRSTKISAYCIGFGAQPRAGASCRTGAYHDARRFGMFGEQFTLTLSPAGGERGRGAPRSVH